METPSATNLSLILNSIPYTISNLTNNMTGTNILFNNKTLDIDESIDVNRTFIKIKSPILVKGEDSITSLRIFLKCYYIKDLKNRDKIINNVVKAIYDQ